MLAQANRIDGRELVEGHHLSIENGRFHFIVAEASDGRARDIFYPVPVLEADYEIDPQTLKYSFDGGESFWSGSEIQEVLKPHKNELSKE